MLFFLFLSLTLLSSLFSVHSPYGSLCLKIEGKVVGGRISFSIQNILLGRTEKKNKWYKAVSLRENYESKLCVLKWNIAIYVKALTCLIARKEPAAGETDRTISVLYKSYTVELAGWGIIGSHFPLQAVEKIATINDRARRESRFSKSYVLSCVVNSSTGTERKAVLRGTPRILVIVSQYIYTSWHPEIKDVTTKK